MTLYLLRHGHSVGNQRNIVQSDNYDFGLSSIGINEVLALKMRLEIGREINPTCILTSPSKRTRETSNILNENLRLPILELNCLKEVNPGVFEGEKKELAKTYPEHLKTWERRGDLDSIPKAEKGTETQARALYFLERYLNEETSPLLHDELIISHAGFMRVLINTVYGRNRNFLINSAHNYLHQIKFNPWERLLVENLVLAKNSESFKITTNESEFIMKRISNLDPDINDFQFSISKEINKSGIIISPMLYTEPNLNGTTVQIYRYLTGTHINSNLNQEQERNLFSLIENLNQRLTKIYSSGFRIPQEIQSLESIIRFIINNSDSEIVKNEGKEILTSSEFLSAINREKNLIHYDIHKSNIVFENNRPSLLDLGSFCIAPNEFQYASLLMPYFLLEEGENFNYRKYLNYFSQTNPKELLWLMRARNYFGLNFFHNKIRFGIYQEDDINIYNKYLTSLKKLELILNEFT
ncbi:histidine phosphatase family protein [Candidatus Woesearchaeota archaeon]|nr:histidine phosphatase family protein [Candidatus Woesearchaeota archaeon]USN44822.1 MAG: histidine phosphatase family protein [Candidatus Woesearchaeota archaeon]